VTQTMTGHYRQRIYKDGDYLQEKSAGGYQSWVTGLSADTTYKFKVRHYNSTSDKYSAYSNEIEVTTGSAESSSVSDTIVLTDSSSDAIGTSVSDTLSLSEVMIIILITEKTLMLFMKRIRWILLTRMGKWLVNGRQYIR